ncbi:MAG TPA: carboxypeptidase-like regulatory domain-containing protein [Pyrinomonadaceae bacterium]|nr:carboxypeptidase-like regulatory domain-containing protein [Pyrinomonadaceae bacterium]
MTRQKDSLDRMRIASPCNVGWENMSGDDRTRFCDQCSLHVYNISALTRDEVALLIKNTEGRICARLHRRVDGTVLTRDCPVGLRALRRRVAKMAGAALTAVISLCAVAVGQSKSQEDKTCTAKIAVKVKREPAQDGEATLSGRVLDPQDAVVAGAEVELINEETKKKLTTTSTEDGEFRFHGLAAGKYFLEIRSVGFKTNKISGIVINPKEAARLNATLEVSEETVVVGILVDEASLLIERPGGTTTIRNDIIQKLPLP